MNSTNGEENPAICINCRWWKQSQVQAGQAIGECRRNPPNLITLQQPTRFGPPQMVFQTVSVSTPSDFWCGEFQRVPLEVVH